LTTKYQMSEYLTEVKILPGSKLAGQTPRDADLNRRFEVTVLAVLRGDETFTEDLAILPLAVADLLIVRGSMERFQRLRADQGVALLSDSSPSDDELAEAEQVVVEAIVPPNSSLIGTTLKDVEFRRRYRAFVLAIRRHGSTLRTRLAHTPLAFSDTLLLITPRKRLEELRQRDELVVTSELDLQLRPHRFWWLILVLLPAVVVGAGLGLFDIAAGSLVACVALMATGALEPREAYRSIDWSVLFFIAAFIPLGDAMFNTGAADYLAALLLSPLGALPPHLAPWVAISALYLFTSLFTEVVSNNATAIVFTPLAIAMAHELGVDPRPFVFTVCFAASASFMTPTGYQTNMMVYGPGGYRFGDFVRFGAPLNLIFWILGSLLIPRFWPF
ncbi:MAG: anion permease, partial [Thermoanaerobaculia bacterium]|nr:anion permease [Thermoanaerobaculia bacterium]